jgi:hypothetical protein
MSRFAIVLCCSTLSYAIQFDVNVWLDLNSERTITRISKVNEV